MGLASKPRARLTETQVINIFQSKSAAPSAAMLARSYGVSEKAVRDIWKGRTWCKETRHLEAGRTLQVKQVGRPRGSRDKIPRRKRAATNQNVSVLANDSFLDVLSGSSLDFICAPVFNDGLSQTATHDLSTQNKDTESSPIWSRDLAKDLKPSLTPNSKERFQENQKIAQLQPSQGFSREIAAGWLSNVGHRYTIDAQLNEWVHTLWSYPGEIDPFRQDWAPLRCEYD